MSYPFPADLREMIEGHLARGRHATEDDVLREALRALTDEEEDLAAVQEALAEWRAGDKGMPLDEARWGQGGRRT